MTEAELRDRILHREHLERQDPTPAASHDPSFDMTEDELRRYCNFLYQQLLDKDRVNELVLSELRAIKACQGAARTESLEAHYVSQAHADKLLSEISELRNQLMSAHKEIALLLKENRDLRDALGVVNGEHYGSSKSRKGISKQRNTQGCNDGRDDFDGTPSSLGNADDASCTSDGDISFDQTAGDEDSSKVYHGPARKGCKYNKSVVGEPVVHLSDRTKLRRYCHLLL